MIPALDLPDLMLPEARPTSGSGVPKNVLNMPGTGASLDNVIVELVLMGIAVDQIAVATGKTEDVIKRYMASEYFYTEITSRGQTLSLESLRNMIRVCAFMSVARLPALIQSRNEATALKACQMCLDNTLAPAKLVDLERQARVGTPDEVRKEADRLKKINEDLKRKLDGVQAA